MDELVDWLHHESITRAATNTATGYIPSVKKTNADRIRAMSDEELADWLIMNGDGSDYETWLEWLKQECEN